MKYRKFNQLYAWFNGYFWLPCSYCKQMTGGHEWEIDRPSTIPDPQYPDDGGRGVGICSDCVDAGVSEKVWAEWESQHGPRWG